MTKKTQNFSLILKKSVEKVLKTFTKKVISKNVMKLCTFSIFTNVRQTCLLITFFCIFLNFFNGFENSMKFCVL
jgi:hypothetical protein